MMTLFAILVWILILGLIGSLAVYGIRQLPIHPTLQRIAIAILCLMGIIVILGVATGQIPTLAGLRIR